MRDTVSCEVTILSTAKVIVDIGHASGCDKIVDTRCRQGVEIAAQDERNLCAVGVLLGWPWLLRGIWLLAVLGVTVGEAVHDLVFASRELCPSIGKVLDAFQENSYLNELNIGECGVPKDVDISNDEPGASDTVLKESNNCNVVTRHDTVEYIVLSLHIRSVDGSVGKVDELLIQQDVPIHVSICFAV